MSNNHAQGPSASENEIKAALIYNFAKFVEWPAPAFPQRNHSIIFCVLSETPSDQELDSLKNKTLKGMSLEIKYLQNAREVESCHLLYILSSQGEPVEQILQLLDGSSVLTIGQTEGFTQLGGMINFTVFERKVRFEINQDSAQRAGLTISSKLLALAQLVTGEKP